MIWNANEELKCKRGTLRILENIDEDLSNKNASILSFTNTFEQTMRKLSKTVKSNEEEKKMPVYLSILGSSISKEDMVGREDFLLLRNEYQGNIFEHPYNLISKHPRIKSAARTLSRVYNAILRDGGKWSQERKMVYDCGARKNVELLDLELEYDFTFTF